MTEHKSFKRIVRTRMDKTGESYTAARAALLTAEEPDPAATPVFTVSDEVIRRRTGRGWEEWFGLLDGWNATDRSHTEIARWVGAEHGADGWSSQAVTVSYERARGMRAFGETTSGFTASVSKTIGVPVERLFDAFVDASERAGWLPDGELRERTSTRPRSARFDWGDGTTRVNVGFAAKGDGRSTVGLSHERLADAADAEGRRAYWRERLAALKAVLEA